MLVLLSASAGTHVCGYRPIEFG